MSERDRLSVELERFYGLLERELDEGNPHLDEAGEAALRDYYSGLIARPRRRPFYRYNWTGRLRPAAAVLARLAAGKGRVRVLDAGCGCGTESILWASFGPNVHVLGVEPDAGRLAAARARPAYYRDLLGPLSVEFVSDSAFNALSRGPFELIWVMEAISHIDPAEQFLRRAADALAPGGHLAVTDSNLLNPAMALKVWRLRRQGAPGMTMTAETGATVHSAPERLFATGRVARLLCEGGLEVARVQRRVFFPPCCPAPLLPVAKAWDRLAAAVPGLKALCGVYSILARRP
ncbi:MAG: class I SAM-dependent methyltransferase [Planctomycetota bacterium]